MKHMSIIWFTVLMIVACNSETSLVVQDIPTASESVKIESNFANGEDGWVGGFSDYPPGSVEGYRFAAEIRTLPTDEQVKGYLLASSNRSDDVFMYIKRQFLQLKSGVEYTITGEITFYSNAGVGCFGIGGSPGEAVFMKIGASEIEPLQVDYYMNIDIGSQSQNGYNSQVIGNAGADGANCDDTEPMSFGKKTIQIESEKSYNFTASDNGSIWLFIGSDSGYEGYTELYYTDISLLLTPVE
jgi:hypothetical protein